MNEPSMPNSDALVAALREASVNSAVAGDLKLRVHSRLSVSLLGLFPAATSGVPGASAAAEASTLGHGVAARTVTTKVIIAASLAPVFALGVLTGIAADRLQQHKNTAAMVLNVRAVSGALPIQAAPAVVLAPSITPENLTPVEPNKLGTSATTTPLASEGSSTLAAERNLLDQARGALARGEPAAGLAPLERHATRFPKGVLTEEREALAVRVLGAMGNMQAAATRAEGFHRRFPNSLFTPAVDNALSTISRRNGVVEPKP